MPYRLQIDSQEEGRDNQADISRTRDIQVLEQVGRAREGDVETVTNRWADGQLRKGCEQETRLKLQILS